MTSVVHHARLGEPPLFTELAASRRILIAGAGGGYDVFCGLPLYFSLRAQGKEVFLANLSFSDLSDFAADEIADGLVPVSARSADSLIADYYFPELHLARWFAERGEDVTIYCFNLMYVPKLLAAYRSLVKRLGVDTIILVDGGTDSLMRGDEQGLGTPVEDICSIAAVSALTDLKSYLVCLGFGIDRFHGVCDAHVLENIAALSCDHGYLGSFSLTREMPEADLYAAACAYGCVRSQTYRWSGASWSGIVLLL